MEHPLITLNFDVLAGRRAAIGDRLPDARPFERSASAWSWTVVFVTLCACGGAESGTNATGSGSDVASTDGVDSSTTGGSTLPTGGSSDTDVTPTTDGASSTGVVDPSVCGDGVRTHFEACDGADLAGGSCTSALGVLALGGVGCAPDCKALDLAGCSAVAPVSVSVGFDFACAALNDASLKCWGQNFFGQLGTGDTEDRGDEPGELGALLPAVDVGAGRHVLGMSNGVFFMCAVLDDNSVKCWGFNDRGQLGQGDTATRGIAPGELGDGLPAIDLGTGQKALAVSSGAGFACALLEAGAVKCWGQNGEGKLGLGDIEDRGDQPGEMGDALPAVDLGAGKKAIAVAAGNSHACALLDGGAVKCWGRNEQGQLGLGDTQSRGDQPGELGDVLPAVELGAGRFALAIAAGENRTCAVLDDHSVKCWGDAGWGALGQGDWASRGDQPGEMGDQLPRVDLGTGRTAKEISVGRYHVCALLDDGSVKCWGRGDGGQLGLGDTINRGGAPGEMGDALPPVDLGAGRTALSVKSAYDMTCALLDNRTIKCWGLNSNGGLGLGDTLPRGGAPAEMGDQLRGVSLVASQRVLNGFVPAGGAQSFANVCELLPSNALNCDATEHPFGAEPLPPANITLAPGTYVADRFGAAFWAGTQQKLLQGYLRSDGAQEWIHVCDVTTDGAFQCDEPPVARALPPPGIELAPGLTVGGRFTFIYREHGRQRLHNGFVQSDGAQTFSQICDIFDDAFDCAESMHPFASAPVPAGLVEAPGAYLRDRFTFALVVDGAQKLRDGFVQSDGAQSFSQTCDIAPNGTTSCAQTFDAFPLPPPGVPADAVIHHRFALTFLR